MTINTRDLGRLVGEMAATAPDDFSEWLEKATIEEEAIVHLVESLKQTMVVVVQEEDFTLEEAIDSTIVSAFQLGWSAHKEYGHGFHIHDPREEDVMRETPTTPEPETPEPDEPPDDAEAS